MLALFAGQSNALGFLNTGPAPYTPTARVQMWTDVNENGQWDVGDNFRMFEPRGMWGPEVQFANEWLAANTEGVLYLGKVAKGSTSLDVDWKGPLLNQALTVKAHMQANLGVQTDAVMWMQGESDAFDYGQASRYHDNLSWLAELIDAPMIVGRIGDVGPYAAEVRYAQWLVDQERDDLVSFRTLGYDMQADGLHYSEAGHLQLGRGFWDAWNGI